MNIRVRELPSQRVAYMRYVGPYGAHGIPELWNRFVTWILAHGFDLDKTTRLGVAHDDPPSRRRRSAATTRASSSRTIFSRTDRST